MHSEHKKSVNRTNAVHTSYVMKFYYQQSFHEILLTINMIKYSSIVRKLSHNYRDELTRLQTSSYASERYHQDCCADGELRKWFSEHRNAQNEDDHWRTSLYDAVHRDVHSAQRRQRQNAVGGVEYRRSEKQVSALQSERNQARRSGQSEEFDYDDGDDHLTGDEEERVVETVRRQDGFVSESHRRRARAIEAGNN